MARATEKWPSNDGNIPRVRIVRVAFGTGCNTGEGNRRASRKRPRELVSPPESLLPCGRLEAERPGCACTVCNVCSFFYYVEPSRRHRRPAAQSNETGASHTPPVLVASLALFTTLRETGWRCVAAAGGIPQNQHPAGRVRPPADPNIPPKGPKGREVSCRAPSTKPGQFPNTRRR